jgi:hypothetical protein
VPIDECEHRTRFVPVKMFERAVQMRWSAVAAPTTAR